MTEVLEVEVLNKERPHSHVGPSSLALLEICACFEQDDSKSDNTAADAGTRCHEAVEHDDPERIVDEYERECVMKCLLFKQGLKRRFPDARHISEMKLSTSHHHGTADYVVLNEATKEAVLVDWKFGAGEVDPPEDNIQFWSYANMLMLRCPWIEKCHIYCVQPKCHDEPQYAVFGREMLPKIDARIRSIIAACENPNKKPFLNSKSCPWCTSKAKCQAMQDVAVKAYAGQYGLTFPKNLMIGIDHSPVEIGQVHAFASLLADFAKQLKDSNNETADQLNRETGEVPPGCSLVRRKGNLKVIDVQRLAFEADKLVGCDPAEILFNCCTVSAKQVMELLHDRYGVDVDAFAQWAEENKVFERGKESTFLKKKSGKIDIQLMLNGALK